MEEVKSKREKNKKWIITVAVFLGLCSIGIGFLYYKHATRHFTRSEYIKEVIIQNDDFNNLIDEFLDKVSSYSGTQEDIEKVENSAGKITEFVSVLKEKLGPRVADDSKEHYDKMIKAYDMYIEAIEMYKRTTPKNAGPERSQQMYEAQQKLIEAQNAMKSL